MEIEQAESSDPRMGVEGREASAKLLLRQWNAQMKGFVLILPPVATTMILAAITVVYLVHIPEGSVDNSAMLVYDEHQASTETEKAEDALINALVIVGFVCGATFVIVLCLKYNCMKLFFAYIIFSVSSLLAFTTSTMVQQGLQNFWIPTDAITYGLFFYNFAVVGVLSIFSFEMGFQGNRRKIPMYMTQIYLIIISVVMAWIVTTIFPTFTTWALLIMLALYDLCAVLTPCGPLNLLIQEAQRQQDEGRAGQMMPGLLFEVDNSVSEPRPSSEYATVPVESDANASSDNEEDNVGSSTANASASAGLLTFMVQESDSESESRLLGQEEEHVPPSRDTGEPSPARSSGNRASENREVEESSLKLGLGDFVFYSVLTAKAAEAGFIATVMCVISVLCGLCGTLILLAVYQKALPALPISIALGVTAYVLAENFVRPMVNSLPFSGVAV